MSEVNTPELNRATASTAVRMLATAALSLGMIGAAVAQNAVIVNNVAIPTAQVDRMVKSLVAQGRPDNPALRLAVREELIARELFVQEATRRKLTEKADVKAELSRSKQDILIGSLIRDLLGSNPVTPADVKSVYDKQVAKTGGQKDYRASHILVETEKEANDIIAKLAKGADFKKLAKVSKDPGSGGNGGDLNWNKPGTFVAEFSQAMVALKKGEVTKKPVKTQFGFHVIKLVDVREATPPAMASIAPQIKQQLERDRVGQLQKKLRDSAKIE